MIIFKTKLNVNYFVTNEFIIFSPDAEYVTEFHDKLF